jgi:hypothetical protein
MSPLFRQQRMHALITMVLAVVILVPALIGFAAKFREFLALWGDEQGAFAIAPIVNYLLATAGFFLLLCWAILHGMFRDIEQPKRTMLQQEKELNEEERLQELIGQD